MEAVYPKSAVYPDFNLIHTRVYSIPGGIALVYMQQSKFDGDFICGNHAQKLHIKHCDGLLLQCSSCNKSTPKQLI